MSRNSYWIETLGCPKNIADSRRMDFYFLKAGFQQAKSAKKSDFLIINSCSFIKEAQEETIQTIFSSLEYKQKNSDMSVVLVGCFAERFASEVKEEIPELDLIIGTGMFEQVPTLIKEKYNLTLDKHDGGRVDQAILRKSNRTHAFFQVAQGCSRNCSFCIIPTIRGNLVKYDIQRIDEQYNEELSLRGTVPLREAVIVSQDTINQGIDELREIIEYFSSKDTIDWIRLQYLFPDKRVLKLLDLYLEYPKLVGYLDIPFQHVSSDILKKMNRPHDITIFEEILIKWKEVRPNGDIRTSFIIGFPGETEEHIHEIINFIRKYNIQKVALFRYSHEDGTPAFTKFVDEIPDEEKIRRINYIREEHLKMRSEHRAKKINCIENIMIDHKTKDDFVGRREQDSPDIDEVVFIPIEDCPKDVQIGQIISVKLEMAMEYDWLASYHTVVTV